MARSERRNLVRNRIVLNKGSCPRLAGFPANVNTQRRKNPCSKNNTPSRAAAGSCPMRYRRMHNSTGTVLGFLTVRPYWPQITAHAATHKRLIRPVSSMSCGYLLWPTRTNGTRHLNAGQQHSCEATRTPFSVGALGEESPGKIEEDREGTSNCGNPIGFLVGWRSVAHCANRRGIDGILVRVGAHRILRERHEYCSKFGGGVGR